MHSISLDLIYDSAVSSLTCWRLKYNKPPAKGAVSDNIQRPWRIVYVCTLLKFIKDFYNGQLEFP